MAKVLVTGGSGFIGWHVVKTLMARGDEVTCLVRRTSQVDRLRQLGVRLAYGDVTDAASLPAAISGNDVVYHLAGCIRALRTAEYYRVNADGVKNVAQACSQQATPSVLVLVSSLSASGPALRGRLRTEDDPPVQVSHYGRSKWAGELVARTFADRVPITVVRPPLVFGEADWAGLDIFRSIARWGVHMSPCLARYKVSLIHAADLADLVVLAAQRGARLQPAATNGVKTSRGCYFAACREHPVYAELGRLIGTLLGRRRVLMIPAATPVVYLAAAGVELVSQIRRRPLTLILDRARDYAAGAWLCSPQRAIDELGFAVETPLIERLRQTIAWYRQEGWL